jgi:hypothetical protein
MGLQKKVVTIYGGLKSAATILTVPTALLDLNRKGRVNQPIQYANIKRDCAQKRGSLTFHTNLV